MGLTGGQTKGPRGQTKNRARSKSKSKSQAFHFHFHCLVWPGQLSAVIRHSPSNKLGTLPLRRRLLSPPLLLLLPLPLPLPLHVPFNTRQTSSLPLHLLPFWTDNSFLNLNRPAFQRDSILLTALPHRHVSSTAPTRTRTRTRTRRSPTVLVPLPPLSFEHHITKYHV